MKSSKERKMDRKRKHKELAVSKTEQSRQRRVANKAKRDEIHAIDPDMKIVIINEKTYDKDGIEVQVIDDKIVNVLELAVPKEFKPGIIEAEKGKAIDIKIEKERIGMFSKLANKLRRK